MPTAVIFIYAGSCYFMYAESRYFISMLTADEAGHEAAETLKPREVVYFYVLFMQKAVFGAEAACVIPGSSKRVSFAPVCIYRVVDFLNSLT